MTTTAARRRLLPPAYRPVFGHRQLRRLLPAFAASDLGDGMSMVAVAWLAIVIAPAGQESLLLGAAVAAYALPGAAGALVFGRWLRRLPARRLVVVDSALRAALLGGVPIAWAAGALHPALYVGLLGGSSLLHAWGGAGKFTLVGEMLPDRHRLAANSLLGASVSASMVVGPAAAGFLATAVSPAWIIGIDALSFAVLAVQAGRLRRPVDAAAGAGAEAGVEAGVEADAGADADAAAPVDTRRSADGLRLLRRQPELLGILVLTWLFNTLYGPVEVALPLHVTQDLHAGSGLLGLYWTLFGVGAVVGSLAVGALRRLPLWPVTLAIVAGWGVTLLPYGLGAGPAITLGCFALGGAIYGPYTAMSYTLFQNRTPAAWLTTVLAARVAVLLTSTPVGVALGGPLVAALSPRTVLAGSGVVTLVLAAVAVAVRLAARRR